ncbi:MAG: hypothetical protein AAFQ37_15155, partial [Bacteroidota bacterium]
PLTQAAIGKIRLNSPLFSVPSVCLTDLEYGYVDLVSPVISLPSTANNFLLSFDHYFSIERMWDGGLLYLVRNGGTPSYVSISHFIFNGYTISLVSLGGGNNNPMGGRFAFSGSDENSNSGSWGQTQVDLSSAGVQPGDDIQLIWRMSYDDCNGWLGWYLDDVELGYCLEAALPVSYTNFQATPLPNAVQLNWQTEAEENNEGFYVERKSATDRNFQTIGWVAATGQPSANYSFLDREVQRETIFYYRLRQRDVDGQESYSAIVTIRLDDTISKPGLSIFPNPCIANQPVSLVRENNTNYPVQLYDLSGRLAIQGFGKMESPGLEIVSSSLIV